MIYIVIFVCVGATCLYGQHLMIIGAITAAFLLALPLIFAYFWLMDQSGVTDLLNASWRFLSGVHDGGKVVATTGCATNDDGSQLPAGLAILVVLAIIVLGVANGLLVLAAIVIFPLSLLLAIVMTVVYARELYLWKYGGRWGNPSRETLEELVSSYGGALSPLALGSGLVIASGLLMRVMHALSLAGC